jgi:hypothetical protein
MSMDLGVFFTTRPHTDEKALKRYVAYCEEDDLAPYIEASPKVGAFLAELTETYPQIDDVSEAELDDCPWRCAFDVSEGHILMPMVSSKYEEAGLLIVALAQKHGLVCFDPISGVILSAPDGIYVKPKASWWRFWK